MRLNPVVHELAGALRWLGIRDRLRCPRCKAVGTYKPHGTLWDRWRDQDRAARRWMCKCCGLYHGPEGTHEVRPEVFDGGRGCWVLMHELDPQTVDAWLSPAPVEVLTEMGVWPWRG